MAPADGGVGFVELQRRGACDTEEAPDLAPYGDAFSETWFPVAATRALRRRPLACIVLGQPLVLARLGGALAAFADYCPHRGVPLSGGRVCGAHLRCL